MDKAKAIPRRKGRMLDNLSVNPKICINAFAIGAMRTHARAFEFPQEHACVRVFGTAAEVTDNAKKHTVMAGTFAKHAPHLTAGMDYAAASQEEIDETTVIKVSIDNWSGKMKWTDDLERPRFSYDDVRKDIPAPYPWANQTKPLTAEWKNSTRGD